VILRLVADEEIVVYNETFTSIATAQAREQLHRRLNGLTQHDAKLAMKDIEPINLSWMGQHILQLLRPQKVVAPGTIIVVVPSLRMGKCLEDGERRLGIAQSEPRPRQGFLVDARVDVAQESRDELFFAGFGFKLDEVGFLSRGVVYAVDEEAGVGGGVFGPGWVEVGHRDRDGGGLGVLVGQGHGRIRTEVDGQLCPLRTW